MFRLVVRNSCGSYLADVSRVESERLDRNLETLLHLAVVRGEVEMVIINQKLTPLYVQYEAIQAQQKMVNLPNHTEIYIPVGPTGVPVLGTMKLGQEGKQN